MKRFLFILTALLATLVVNAQLQVKELTLSNGMTVWLNEDHSQPKVFGAVVVRAGAKDCPNTGIAHYFEHILFKGTNRMGTIDYAQEKPWLDSISAQYDLLSQTRDEAQRSRIQQHINALSLRAADYAIPNEFNRLISRYGGSGLNAATGFDETYYYNSFLPQYMEQWCLLNSERLISPVFRGFQGELENVYEEKNRSADGLGDAMDKVFKAVFKEQPYAYPIIGSTENLKNPRLSDMQAFYRKYYVAPNMCLILCGDITADSILVALLERTFGRIQTGSLPERTPSPMPDITAGEQCQVRLPIPIISAEALVFRGPTDYEADAVALEMANMLLSNGKAGLLDSLMNEHRLLAAGAGNMSLADAGGTALFVVPKLFGKMKKAEAACLEQLERIKHGDFSTQQMETLKQDMLMEAERSIETIDNRAIVLIDAFAQGHTWQDIQQRTERIRRLTKDDVVQAAQRYYGANYIKLTKKYGTPDKETLKQPGYKPISPKNADAKSEMARQLEQLPLTNSETRLVDFERDVTTQQLSPHVTLYYKENPVNDIFTFTLRYKNGKQHTPALAILDDYLNSIGTDSLTKQQLAQAWQRIGVTMEAETGNKTFSIQLTGPDSQLRSALSLLAHFLHSAKGDKDALDDVKSEDKVSRKSFGKQKDEVFQAVLERILYGSRSTFLNQLSKKDIKALTNDDLLSLFREVQQYDCELFYCGRNSAEYVATELQHTLPLQQCHHPQADTYRPAQTYPQPTVYFYNVPKSRQNYVISYDQLAPQPTAIGRVTEQLWARYFGGGMSSVLFQNVREFQSLAYSTYGYTYAPSLATHPQEPLAYITVTGTQADKTLQALNLVDSLLRHLPMKEENLNASRQELLNNIQNNYPTFRHIASYVANQRMNGYTANPDADVVRYAPTTTAADVAQFHRQHVANNQRIWIVIGDRKLTDPQTLARYGKVVELKKEEVYR